MSPPHLNWNITKRSILYTLSGRDAMLFAIFRLYTIKCEQGTRKVATTNISVYCFCPSFTQLCITFVRHFSADDPVFAFSLLLPGVVLCCLFKTHATWSMTTSGLSGELSRHFTEIIFCFLLAFCELLALKRHIDPIIALMILNILLYIYSEKYN